MGKITKHGKRCLQGADAVFSATEKTIRWTRGEGDLDPEQFCAEFKSLKPCLHGSDGHHLDMLGMPDNKRFCWIKAEPTFEGLKQVLYEPRERVFIGEEPPQLKNDYQVIESIRVEASDWFNATEIPLNADLVAIIGSTWIWKERACRNDRIRRWRRPVPLGR